MRIGNLYIQRKKQRLLTALFLLGIGSCSLVSAAPVLVFTGTTPNNYENINTGTFGAQVDVTENNLSSLSWNLSGIQYPIYDSGLLLMYNFDNVSSLGENSVFVKDLSLYNNTGIVYNGATRNTAGKYNGAYSFDGINDRIASATSLGLTGKIITASLWFKVPQYQSLNGSILMEYSRDSNTTNAFSIAINCGSNCLPGGPNITGSIAISMHDGGGYMMKTTLQRYDDNQWHQIVVVIDKNITNSGELKIYMDGDLVDSYLANGFRTILSQNFVNTGIYIGSRSDNNRRLSGYIDEVRIWNRTLSSGEISQLYRYNLSKYASDKWLFTTSQFNILTGIYTYGITATDIFNQTSLLTRTIRIDMTGLIKYVLIPNTDITGIRNEFINAGYQENTNSILIGTKDISFVNVSGTVAVPIVMQSTGTTSLIEAEFSGSTQITTTGGDTYTGIVKAPQMISTTGISLPNIKTAASFGTTNQQLFFDKPVTIRMPVPGAKIGSEIKIYVSEDGVHWKYHTTTIAKIINNKPYVEFLTTHFSDYVTQYSLETQGEISLQINSGNSNCLYGTAVDLGTKSINSTFGALMFTGGFVTASGNTNWSCTDFAGSPAGWDLTIQTSNLTNETNNIISGTNVKISHDIPLMTAGSCAAGATGATNISINTVHTILAKQASVQRTICKIQTNNVSLKVDVPANQAPGKYIGTLTITLPTFN